MIVPRISRRIGSIAAWALLAMAGGPACSDGSGGIESGGGSGGGGSAPALSGLQFSPQSAALNDGFGSVQVYFQVTVADADADVTKIVLTVLDAANVKVDELTGTVTNPPGQTNGMLSGQFPLSTAAVLTYTLQVQAWDGGGHGSNVLEAPFPIVPGNPVPTIATISPQSATVGDAAFTLTVTGTDFMATSSVFWNGTYLPTTYVDASTLTAQVQPYHFGYAQDYPVTVTNPPPGGGTSNALTFTVNPEPPRPAPTLASVSPSTVEAGTASVTLTATGSGFGRWSTLRWNGSSLSTTYVDSTTLQATVYGYQLAVVGTAALTVYTPAPGGGTSSSVPFEVTRPALPGVAAVSLRVNDLVWDPYQQRLYASVPGASAVNPNTISVIDPFTGQITSSQFAGSEPGPLAISDDGQFLYAGLGGAATVRRFSLPSLAADLDITLGRHPTNGPYFARALEVAPAAAHVLAVALETRSYNTNPGGVAVFDDAVQRATTASSGGRSVDSLQWGASASILYGSSMSYLSDLFVMSVDASGATLTNDFTYAFSGSSRRIHFDPLTEVLYGDDGRVVAPATGLPVGTYPLGTGYYAPMMTPDSSLGSAFFAAITGGYGSWPELRAYDLTEYFLTRTLTLPYYGTPANRLLRFGPDGVALIAGQEVVLVRGPFVLPVSTTTNPLPTVASIAPSSALAGSGNFRLTVTGTDFVPGSVVQWGGLDRSTRFVSATELVAFIPASDVATAGTPQVAVTSPVPGGGTSGTVTFTVN